MHEVYHVRGHSLYESDRGGMYHLSYSISTSLMPLQTQNLITQITQLFQEICDIMTRNRINKHLFPRRGQKAQQETGGTTIGTCYLGT